jgi:hypothetical protein
MRYDIDIKNSIDIKCIRKKYVLEKKMPKYKLKKKIILVVE